MKPAFRGIVDWLIRLVGISFVLYGIGCQTTPSYTEPPPDWQADDGRWWQADVDTAHALRDLQTFQDMGIPFEEVVFDANQPPERQPVRMKRRVINDVKKELLPFFRHRPEVVDSLFEQFVAPTIRNSSAPKQANFDDTVERQKDRAYQVLRQHFAEPRARLTLGDEVPIVYPDSLRTAGIGGHVRMQVFLNDQGQPLAIELLEGVHPVLDKIALRAATQMRWEPTTLEGTPIRSWVRYSIHFTP